MKTTCTKAICLALFLISFGFANAEVLSVTGKVTDASDNSPLVGVPVTIKGTNIGTLTDANGQYSISTEKGKILIFSYIGFITKEIKATKSRIDVALQPDTKALSEVMVVGHVPQKKTTLCGSIAGIQVQRGYYPPPVPAYDYNSEKNEEYKSFAENRFKDAKADPLSTFSLDVDAASYSNIRRMINLGQKPEKNSIRTEECINYFSYNYPNPTGKHPVNILTETQSCPWAKDHLLVRIGVKAKEIPSDNLPASNFVFLIDVSGSMGSANRLPLVIASMKLLVNNLRDKDRVAIVTYAGAAGEALPSTPGSDKQKITEALNNLQAGGSTAGGAGIQLAYKIAEKNFIKGGNNRIILCTDGDFNVGVSSTDDLESLIAEKRKTGVYLTVLGYGMGNYKDAKLQTLAEKGNGNHSYIDNLQEANKVLVSEFGSTMYAVAKDVKLQVEFNPKYVNAYRLIGYESRLLNKEDFNDDKKDAGELGAGHTVTAFYEIIPVGVKNNYGSVDDLKYQKTNVSAATSNNSNELMTVKLRYKPIDSDTSIKMEVPVMAGDREKKMSEDFAFASAVAMFSQLLRDSDFKGDATYDKVVELARKGLGNDPQGYRREFIRLAEAAKQLEK
ncbi:vWA domain-containing protein [Paludibacter jiangxiensis]|uniref:Ca-activated chloride channel family protein n=1 Tax=Paludibacter jiangxiensis TaxID=681398 RepID=A0A170Z8Z0_9BACT|nr:VWA domain-containing protein [Paludibacter jiangxiensis]GAT62431.1 Ca-activated chloride channel family protein [Paludibacter jiangxiensis]